MEQFQKQGVQSYGQVLKELKAMGENAYFYTPNNKVIITDQSSSISDGVIIVATPIGTSEQVSSKHALHQLKEFGSLLEGKKVIVLINKLDAYDWSESIFTKAVKSTADELGISAESTPFIPVSGLQGDNLIEPSSKCPWYFASSADGQAGTRNGTTLLKAVDAMLS